MDQQRELLIHFLIAMLCVPIYVYMGESYKFIIAPYVIWLVLSERAVFFPALLLHFLTGTTMSTVILLACLILSLLHFRYWNKVGLGFVFVLALMPLPIYIYQTYYRLALGEGVVSTVLPLSYYLGLFAFFYGIRVAKGINLGIIEFIFYFLLAVSTIQAAGIFDYVIRYYFLSLPLSFSLLVVMLKGQFKFSRLLKWVTWLACIIGIYQFGSWTLTLIFSVLLGILLTWFKPKKSFGYFFRPTVIFVVSVFLVFYSVSQSVSYLPSMMKGPAQYEGGNVDITDVSQWRERVRFKLFGDRIPVWMGAWKQIVYDFNWVPPLKDNSFSVQGNGRKKIEIDYGAHNLFLELLRSNGIAVGGIIAIIFVTFIVQAGILLKYSGNHPFFVVIASTVFSVGLIGSLFGQYPLMISFSFLLMSLCGVVRQYLYTVKLHGG